MIVRAASALMRAPEAKSFTLIGDPGCDGLGAEIMDIFAAALSGAEGDIVFTLGDLVPVGTDVFYDSITSLVDGVCAKPVYFLPGNHDGAAYAERFGLRDYAVLAGGFAAIMLDNASRSFSEHSLAFVKEVLAAIDSSNIVVMFHVPPPNRMTGNSMNRDKWDKLLFALGPELEHIRYFACGHVHSYFEDDVDGVRLVATGGGGARIEEVDRVLPPPHHVVEFRLDPDGVLYHRRRSVGPGGMAGKTAGVLQDLQDSFAEEAVAHVDYLASAEDAAARGLPNLARLFRAAAESEYRHAKNHQRVMAPRPDPATAVAEAAEAERLEVEETYRKRLRRAKNARDALAVYAVKDALATEKIHMDLFEKALGAVAAGRDIEPEHYHVCTSCGYTFAGAAAPRNCPVCGAPADKIRAVE